MCTVSAIRYVDSRTKRPTLQVMCNRDEQISRPRAEPPSRRRLGDLQAWMPTDPQSGGTWIGVNEAGLVVVLLNVNNAASPPSHRNYRSRGDIVPRLLSANNFESAVLLASRLNLDEYPAFRAWILNLSKSICLQSTGGQVREVTPFGVRAASMLTSSGLGDALVAGPRTKLFQKLVCDETPTPEKQRRFHQHQWPTRGEISVKMNREGARTVSMTTVNVDSRYSQIRYRDIAAPLTRKCCGAFE